MSMVPIVRPNRSLLPPDTADLPVLEDAGIRRLWQHMLVAEGAIDIVVEPSVSLWDLAATKVIVEEAGGCFTDLAGEPRADGGSAVSTNGLLHPDVLAALGTTSP